MNEKVASRAFIPTHNIALGEILHDNASVISAEINAIIMALEFLMVNEYMTVNFKNIIIYSDSLSSLELLSSASQYKMDIDTFLCLRIIDILASRGILTHLQYIPSHLGIIGNHKADEIAKNALILLMQKILLVSKDLLQEI